MSDRRKFHIWILGMLDRQNEAEKRVRTVCYQNAHLNDIT